MVVVRRGGLIGSGGMDRMEVGGFGFVRDVEVGKCCVDWTG